MLFITGTLNLIVVHFHINNRNLVSLMFKQSRVRRLIMSVRRKSCQNSSNEFFTPATI